MIARCLALLFVLSAALAITGWVHSDGRFVVVVTRPTVDLGIDPGAVRPHRMAGATP